MTTEGRGPIGQIQKDLREAQAKLQGLEGLPKELESLGRRIDEIEGIGQKVNEQKAALDVLTEGVGKLEGKVEKGPAKRGEDLKTYAIGIMAVVVIALLVWMGIWYYQNQASYQATSQAIQKVASDNKASMEDMNKANSAFAKSIDAWKKSVDESISKLGR